MRAICCAILALVVFQMGMAIGKANNTDKDKAFVSGCALLAAILLVLAAIILCIGGV